MMLFVYWLFTESTGGSKNTMNVRVRSKVIRRLSILYSAYLPCLPRLSASVEANIKYSIHSIGSSGVADIQYSPRHLRLLDTTSVLCIGHSYNTDDRQRSRYLDGSQQALRTLL